MALSLAVSHNCRLISTLAANLSPASTSTILSIAFPSEALGLGPDGILTLLAGLWLLTAKRCTPSPHLPPEFSLTYKNSTRAASLKVWDFLPPDSPPEQTNAQEPDSRVTDNRDGRALLSIVQSAGDDVMYIPAGWHHATTNNDLTIGVAGQAQWRQGEAVEIFTPVAAAHPHNASILRELGSGLVFDGRVEEGIETLYKAAAVDVGCVQTRLLLGNGKRSPKHHTTQCHTTQYHTSIFREGFFLTRMTPPLSPPCPLPLLTPPP
jgi:hypothetical protein